MDEEKNDSRPNTTRRAALQALGVGALAATAGCLFGEDGGTNNATENDSGSETRNTESTVRVTNGETAAGTATHEQSIISGSPAATGTPATRPTDTTATPVPATGTTNRTATATTETTATTGTTRTTGTTTTSATTGTTTEMTSTTTETTSTTTTETTATATSVPESRSTEGWTEKAPLPVVGSDAGGGVLGGKLYFFGGIETAVELDAVSRAFAYDPSAGSAGAWERLPDIPRALWGLCGVATDDALYSFGGAPDNSPYEAGPPSDAIFRYRPGDGWTDLTETTGVRCPYPNWVMGGVYNPADGLIYCVGGGTGAHDAPSATDHGFDGEDVPGTYDESRLWTFDPRTEQVADADLARMPRRNAGRRWRCSMSTGNGISTPSAGYSGQPDPRTRTSGTTSPPASGSAHSRCRGRAPTQPTRIRSSITEPTSLTGCSGRVSPQSTATNWLPTDTILWPTASRPTSRNRITAEVGRPPASSMERSTSSAAISSALTRTDSTTVLHITKHTRRNAAELFSRFE
jgi:hypothetical protein